MLRTLGIGTGITRGQGPLGSVLFPGATIDMNFSKGTYLGKLLADLTVVRASQATDLVYTDVLRTSYATFGNNVPVIDSYVSRGLGSFEARTQYLGVTDAPANQTTSSLGTGTYSLWHIGGTSVTVAAGTATITGAGSATPNNPLTFTVTVAGTVVITVSGAVRYFQLENGAPTTYIPNAGAAGSTATRAVDLISLGPGTAFSDWYTNAAAGTFYCEFRQYNGGGGGFGRMFVVSDGTSANFIDFEYGGATNNYLVTTGSANQSTITFASPAFNTLNKVAMRYGANDFQAAFNGVLGTADTSGTVPTVTQVHLGNRFDNPRAVDGWLGRFSYIPLGRVDATLVSMSA